MEVWVEMQRGGGGGEKLRGDGSKPRGGGVNRSRGRDGGRVAMRDRGWGDGGSRDRR